MVAFACYGPVPGADRRFSLHWIAVRDDLRRSGVGGAVLRQVEQSSAALGAARLYVEAATRDRHRPTHLFYRKNGYRKLADLPDFYRDGEGKAIYAKTLDARVVPESRPPKPGAMPSPARGEKAGMGLK